MTMVAIALAVYAAVPAAGEAEAAARSYLSSHGAEHGITPRETLVLRAAPPPGVPGAVRFERRIDGFPVLNGGVNVALDATRAVKRVTTVDVAAELSGRFVLDGTAAADRAAATLGGATVLERDARRGWWSNGSATRAAWEVRIATAEPAGSWALVIDAETGALLFRRNLITHTTTGQVYELSPVEPTASTTCSFDDAGHYTWCASSALQTLPNLTSPTTLTGSQAIVYDCRGTQFPTMSGDTAGCIQSYETPNVDGAYDYPPDTTGLSATDDFAAVMAYFQVDRHLTWLKGLDASVAASLVGLPVFVNAWDRGAPYDNAHYDSGMGGLVLGQGARVDYAYDAAVAFHELDHAVVHMLGDFYYGLDTLGAVTEPVAVNEGVADSLAAAHTGRSKVGYYVGNEDAASSPPPYLRDLDNRKTCLGTGAPDPYGLLDGMDGEVHDDGEIWSGFFWELHEGLKSVPACDGACDAGSAIQLKAIELAGGTAPTLASFAQTAVTAAETLFPDDPKVAQYVRCVASRHELSTCDRTFPMYVDEMKAVYIEYKYAPFQLALHAAGAGQYVVCSALGTNARAWLRPGQPVLLQNPTLGGSVGLTAVDTTAPATTVVTIPSCSSYLSGSFLPGSGTRTVYVLVGSDAPDAIVVLTSPFSMDSRPGAAAPGTCIYGVDTNGGSGLAGGGDGGGGGCSSSGAVPGALTLLGAIGLWRPRRRR